MIKTKNPLILIKQKTETQIDYTATITTSSTYSKTSMPGENRRQHVNVKSSNRMQLHVNHDPTDTTTEVKTNRS